MSSRNIRIFIFGVVIGIALEATIRYFLTNDNDKKHHGRPIILAYGDSITQRGHDGWLGLLSDWYTRKADVLNRGFSGYQTRWALDMFDEVVLPNAPDLVIIFFGANDAVVPEVLQHVPLQVYEENLMIMARKLKNKYNKCTLVFITPPPVYEPDLQVSNSAKGKPIIADRSNSRTKQYAEACKRVASLFGSPVIDAWDGLGANNDNRHQYLIDGLHFNDAGNKRLFELLQKSIISSLPEWIPDNMQMHQKPWNEMK